MTLTTIGMVQQTIRYGATGNNVGKTLMAMAQWATMATIMATLGCKHGHCRHQAYPLPGQQSEGLTVEML